MLRCVIGPEPSSKNDVLSTWAKNGHSGVRRSPLDHSMIRFLAVFLVLFVGAAACLSLLPKPPSIVRQQSAVAAQLRQEVEPAPSDSKVRVVYPMPSVSSVPHEAVSTTSGAEVPNTAAIATASGGQSAAAYPQIERSAEPSASPAVPPDAAAQAGAPGVNLNTASIDALNQIPGAGRIGRMIASHRPYHSVEDLLKKRVIRKSVYERIKDQVAAD
jgi:DNA uptake protein ComE-like DNA-binding protein